MSKKLKDLLKEDITTMGGVVSRPKTQGLDMGFKTQKSTKLTNIVEDMYGDSKPKINVKEFVQEIGQYGSYGKEIYREGNLKEFLLVFLNLETQNNTHFKKPKIGLIRLPSIVT